MSFNMRLPMRLARAHVNPEGLRSEDTHIRQGGSRFGNTHVSGGIAFQDNFAGRVTISKLKRFLASLIHRTTFRLHSATRLFRPVLPLLARASEGVRSTTAAAQPDQDTSGVNDNIFISKSYDATSHFETTTGMAWSMYTKSTTDIPL